MRRRWINYRTLFFFQKEKIYNCYLSSPNFPQFSSNLPSNPLPFNSACARTFLQANAQFPYLFWQAVHTAVTCQRPWLYKSHRSIKITYISYELFYLPFFLCGQGQQKGKDRNVKGSGCQRSPYSLQIIWWPLNFCYLALGKMAFSLLLLLTRCSSSFQNEVKALTPLPWWYYNKVKRKDR